VELAHLTFGYTPVMIEHLLDEALIWALRDGRDGMRWADINQAKLSEEIGLKQPVAYTPLEKEMVATHGAGHAVAAYLSGVGRKLEVLSIVKRKEALGLLRDAKAAVREQLDRNRVLVEALRDALLEREELIGDEVLEVLGRAEAGRATPPRRGPRRACSPAAPPPR